MDCSGAGGPVSDFLRIEVGRWEERKKVETEKICLSLSSAANEEQRNKAVTGKSGGCK